MANAPLAKKVSVGVLTPQQDLKAKLAKVIEIEEFIETSFIPTDRAQEYFCWLDELRLLKQCGRVIGPKGVGKSRASKQYYEEDRKRISYVKVWTSFSSKRLFSSILQDIKHAAVMGRKEDLRPRLAGSLETFGIELVIIDNADQLQKEALFDLKNLFDESNVPIVLIGSRELDILLDDVDLISNFPTLYEFERLSEEDFKKTLRAIEVDILALDEPSNLAEGNIFEILASNTGGKIGPLLQILPKAVLHSLNRGFNRIDVKVLDEIARRYGKKYLPIEAKSE
ncbi:ATP-binding protein [Phormidium sp. LEGE 05292]|uniref:AAA family ATPase n=1 Tax=[Phormidium] sp. LEGE 05292 TaxID=767427 RepID=UPI00187F78A6|nr:ATP-binding protein [Phormidium sp. LEGE 05292]MBE9224010.1 ATP-binding protein [Phormidium sp. LEGE 05292]